LVLATRRRSVKTIWQIRRCGKLLLFSGTSHCSCAINCLMIFLLPCTTRLWDAGNETSQTWYLLTFICYRQTLAATVESSVHVIGCFEHHLFWTLGVQRSIIDMHVQTVFSQVCMLLGVLSSDHHMFRLYSVKRAWYSVYWAVSSTRCSTRCLLTSICYRPQLLSQVCILLCVIWAMITTCSDCIRYSSFVACETDM